MDEQSVTVISLQMAMSIMVLLQLRWNRVGSGGAFSENPVQSQNLLMMFPGVFCWYAIKLLNSSTLDVIPLAFQEITVRLDLFMLQGLKVNFVSWQLFNGPMAFVLYWDGMCYFDEFLEQFEGLSHCRGVELFKVSPADSVEVWAVGDVAWEDFLEVLGSTVGVMWHSWPPIPRS
ncbi:hypothetical protein TNCV_3020301 [Trichonephila clavipes]|nr:hypothetical protein TNCV_3020301 [Trichonephila clavipes]